MEKEMVLWSLCKKKGETSCNDENRQRKRKRSHGGVGGKGERKKIVRKGDVFHFYIFKRRRPLSPSRHSFWSTLHKPLSFHFFTF